MIMIDLKPLIPPIEDAIYRVRDTMNWTLGDIQTRVRHDDKFTEDEKSVIERYFVNGARVEMSFLDVLAILNHLKKNGL